MALMTACKEGTRNRPFLKQQSANVLNAQVQLTTAQSTRLQALFGYNSSLAEFDRVTGTKSQYNEQFDSIAPHATKRSTYYTGSDVDARGRPKRNTGFQTTTTTTKTS